MELKLDLGNIPGLLLKRQLSNLFSLSNLQHSKILTLAIVCREKLHWQKPVRRNYTQKMVLIFSKKWTHNCCKFWKLQVLKYTNLIFLITTSIPGSGCLCLSVNNDKSQFKGKSMTGIIKFILKILLEGYTTQRYTKK